MRGSGSCRMGKEDAVWSAESVGWARNAVILAAYIAPVPADARGWLGHPSVGGMMRLVRWLTVGILALACGALPGAGGVLAEQATKPQAARTTSLIDLNTATREQLTELPGMGKVYADRVIRGRPYSAKNQLTQRGILPLAAYEKIKDLVIARHAP